MLYWVVTIEDDAGENTLGRGWVRAASFAEALTLVPHPDATFYPLMDDAGFPKGSDAPVIWEHMTPDLTH